MLELRKENGCLSAFCAKCGTKLEKTTLQLKELASSGKYEEVEVLCEKCKSKITVNLQLGEKEYGVK